MFRRGTPRSCPTSMKVLSFSVSVSSETSAAARASMLSDVSQYFAALAELPAAQVRTPGAGGAGAGAGAP